MHDAGVESETYKKMSLDNIFCSSYPITLFFPVAEKSCHYLDEDDDVVEKEKWNGSRERENKRKAKLLSPNVRVKNANLPTVDTVH